MSKYIDYKPIHIDEIDYNKCKWLYNEVCCNADSPYVADYPIHKCKSKKDCEFFEKEDGVYKKTLKYYSDFDKFCYNHCKDIDTVLILVEKLQKALVDEAIKSTEKINKLKDKLIGDKMEQFDDYIIYLIESYLEILEE